MIIRGKPFWYWTQRMSPAATPQICRSLEEIRRRPLSFYRYKRRILKRTRKLSVWSVAASFRTSFCFSTSWAPHRNGEPAVPVLTPSVLPQCTGLPSVSPHTNKDHIAMQARCILFPPCFKFHCGTGSLRQYRSLPSPPPSSSAPVATALVPSCKCLDASLSSTSPRFPLTNGHPSSLFRFEAPCDRYAFIPGSSTSVLPRTRRNPSRTQLQVSGCFTFIHKLAFTSQQWPLPSSVFRSRASCGRYVFISPSPPPPSSPAPVATLHVPSCKCRDASLSSTNSRLPVIHSQMTIPPL